MAQTPAHAFPPGEYLRDELDERGWTVTEFAEILGRPVQAVSEILNEKKEITTETAMALSEALGTTAEVWLNLQTRYRLYRQRTAADRVDLTPVARRARLRGVIPLAEVRARGWIPDTGDLDKLEAAACELLEIPSLDSSPSFAVAARRSNSDNPITIKQTAWLGQVRRLAGTRAVADFDVEALGVLAERLPWMLRNGPGKLRQLPDLLGECGVYVVFLEGLRGGKLDGAVSFLDDGRPVIGLTTRNNRFDILLFTLLHECAHLTLGHITADSGAIIEDDLTETSNDPDEIEANEQARTWLFPDGFKIASSSVSAIVEAATRYGRHPSVVIGQVQRETERYSLHRAHIPKVRPELEDAGLLS
ncbi:MAG: HigA family addiction module antitoxin [Acidimicrobiaceae bacterium]|nr:HigA family addiction module antitoxin [Acidimicrobiaceae bacterium]MYA17081.1 HigA family addiction module antidote protein [Gammaproteobacteria bacterium]